MSTWLKSWDDLAKKSRVLWTARLLGNLTGVGFLIDLAVHWRRMGENARPESPTRAAAAQNAELEMLATSKGKTSSTIPENTGDANSRIAKNEATTRIQLPEIKDNASLDAFLSTTGATRHVEVSLSAKQTQKGKTGTLMSASGIIFVPVSLNGEQVLTNFTAQAQKKLNLGQTHTEDLTGLGLGYKNGVTGVTAYKSLEEMLSNSQTGNFHNFLIIDTRMLGNAPTDVFETQHANPKADKDIDKGEVLIDNVLPVGVLGWAEIQDTTADMRQANPLAPNRSVAPGSARFNTAYGVRGNA